MGTAGTQYGEFKTALRTGSYRLACQVARDLPRVDLRDALRLTMLAASKDSQENYEALARRWLERFLSEAGPTLQLHKWATEDLGNLGDPQCPDFVKRDSGARLRELLGRL